MKNKRKLKIKTLLIIAFIGYILVTLVQQQFTLMRLDSKYNDIKTKEDYAIKENKSLNLQEKYIKTDSFIENQARQKLGLIKKGEIMYVDTSRNPKN